MLKDIPRHDAASLSDALEIARKRKRWSQEQLAEIVSRDTGESVGPRDVRYLEECPRRPLRRRQALRAILDVLEEVLPITRRELNLLAGGV